MKTNKLLSVALTLCVLLAAFSLTALAAGDVAKVGGTTYATLAEAVADAADGDTVTLLGNTTEDVTVTGNITLDLGGYTLTNTGAGKATLTIAAGATATVKNGSIVGGASYYTIQNNGTATFDVLTATAGNTGSSMLDNYGTLTITSGTYTGGLDTVKNENTGVLNISGGTFTLEKGTSKGFTAVVFNYGALTITGGTFVQNDKSAPYGQAQVVHTDKDGSVAPSTQISGGTFRNLCTSSTTAWTVRETNKAVGTTKVSGGTFNKKISDGYCADGFIPTKNADGTYGVKVGKYVAKVGNTKYETLADAVRLAAKGKTVTLIDDLDISATGLMVAANKTITLDLNGHTLKAANTNTGNIMVFGKLTLCDSTDTAKNGTGTGKVLTDTPYIYNKQDKVLIAAMDGGTFTMESGLIDTASSIADNANDGQFAVSVQNEHADATVIINGGHIKAGWYAVAGNGTDITYNGNITVNGGILESVADYAIYHPHTGTTTVNGGVIFGAAGGISLNRGKLIVNDGTITSKGTGTTGNWGDGTGNQQAAAINVNAKYETTAVEIKGGKITAEKDAILLTNGRNGTVAVSGGSFSSEIKPEYCAEGFVPAANADGTYGVKVAPVAKIGTVEYATLAEAIAAANDGETVTLIDDLDISTTGLTVAATKTVTLDLNGHALKAANTNTGNIKVLGKLTLCDSTDTEKNGTGTGKVWTDTPYIYNKQDKVLIAAMDGGTFTMESGLIDTASSIADNANDGQFAVSVQNEHADATVIINGGHIKAGWYAVAGNGTDITYNGNITVNGGILESVADYAIYHPHTGTTTVNGGVIFGAAGGISLNRGKLIVNDGTITSKGTGTTGNWGDGTGNQQAAAINVNAAYEATAVEIKGGKITAEKDAILLTNGRDGTVAVSGGTFSSEVKPEYCAEGFVPARNTEDGTYGVKAAPVAKIGTVEYATLNEAFAAAKDGETITIARNFTTDETKTTAADRATVTANVTLDFGSYVMTVPTSLEPTANFMAILVDGGTLTVEGTTGGIVSGDAEICGVYGFNVKGGGKLVINGGSYYCGITVAQAQLGTIEVNGGNFAVNDANGKYPGYMFNCVDANYAAGTAGITVSGGTFAGYDPRNNTAEGKGTSFVAEGVGVDAVDGSFTAKTGMTAQVMDASGASVKAFATFADAIAAAKDGDAVLLLTDTELTDYITVDKAVTLDLGGKTVTANLTSNYAFAVTADVTFKNGAINITNNNGGISVAGKLTLVDVDITGAAVNAPLLYLIGSTETTIDKDSTVTATSSSANSYPAILMEGSYADETITLNIYGSVSCKSMPAVQGNGADKATSKINVYDGASVTSEKLAMYLPQICEVNISGGLVDGYCGVGIKSGTLNITGGTVRGHKNDADIGDQHSTTNGINYDGSAILIDSYIGYAGQVKVNISGDAVVESLYSTAIREIGNDASQTNMVALTVTGGTVKGASGKDAILVRKTTRPTVSVSGGTFSSEVPADYCAEGYTSVKNADGTYTVAEQAVNPFGKSFSVVNKPVMTQDGVEYYTVVVYSGIDSLNYKKAGFAYRMEATKKNNETVKYQDVKETTTAYKAISGTNNQGKTYTYTAEQIGAAYIYGQRFLFPVSDYTSANTALYVTPYVVTLDGKTIYGDEIELTETALSAKGSHLFWQGQ